MGLHDMQRLSRQQHRRPPRSRLNHANGRALRLLQEPAGHDVGLPLGHLCRLPQLLVAGDGKRFTGDAASTPYATGEKVLENRLRLSNIVGGESYDAVANYWANVGVLLAFVLVFRLLAIVFISRRLSS